MMMVIRMNLTMDRVCAKMKVIIELCLIQLINHYVCAEESKIKVAIVAIDSDEYSMKH